MRFAAALLYLTTLGAACQTPSRTSDLTSPVDYSKLPLSESLNQDYFRSSYPHLSDEQFSSKWTASLQSPLLFFRSYVNSWYAEVDKLGIKQDLGPCFGDPHPENFGFIWFGENEFKYYFNDLDDSGSCPVAYDALRYFTALRLYWNSPKLESQVLEAYLSALRDHSEADDSILTNYRPKLHELLKNVDMKYLVGDRIKLTPVVFPLAESEKAAIFQAALDALKQGSAKPDKVQLLDAAQVIIKSGGSGGLLRYSILFRDGSGQKQLIEMKELSKPATDLGDWALNPDISRIDFMNLAWDAQVPRYFTFTQFRDKEFVLRSRVKSDPDLKDLSNDQKLRLFTYQAQLMAKVHRSTLKDAKSLRSWLSSEIDQMSERYREAYQKARRLEKR